jgi:hypothetical protein
MFFVKIVMRSPGFPVELGGVGELHAPFSQEGAHTAMSGATWQEIRVRSGRDDKFVLKLTILRDSFVLATNLSSRPELSWACGSPKVMKSAFYPATAFHGSVALPFVIPSEAEGSAVPRTTPGNVFRQSEAQWRDLRFPLRLRVTKGCFA